MSKNSDSVTATNQEFADALSEENFDGDLLTKLVLAIIKGNPDESGTKSEQARLNAAMKALVGNSYNSNKSSPGLMPAIKWMAWEYMRDRGGPGISFGKNPFAWLNTQPVNATSVKDLAYKASEKFSHATSPENLENRFSKDGLSICKSLALSSEIPITLQQQTLEVLKENLENHGIKLVLD